VGNWTHFNSQKIFLSFLQQKVWTSASEEFPSLLVCNGQTPLSDCRHLLWCCIEIEYGLVFINDLKIFFTHSRYNVKIIWGICSPCMPSLSSIMCLIFLSLANWYTVRIFNCLIFVIADWKSVSDRMKKLVNVVKHSF